MNHRGKSTDPRLSDPTRGSVEGVGRLFGREGIGGGLQHHLVRQLTEDHESVGGRGDPRPARSTTSGGVPAGNVPQPAGGGAPDEAPARSQQIPAYQTQPAGQWRVSGACSAARAPAAVCSIILFASSRRITKCWRERLTSSAVPSRS